MTTDDDDKKALSTKTGKLRFYKRTPTECSVKIADQGKGFDWRKYINLAPLKSNPQPR